ncbi:MAG: S1/P1 Nuclease [Caulobacterales bacterium]|nr:S1/P1 Nuclease [Caulobacterales bacterium]
MKRVPALALAALLAALPSSLLAWGGSGHRMIGIAAMRGLPADLPAFLRTPQAIADVGELSREPDRVKRAGPASDTDREAAHFVDLTDEGRVSDGKVLTGPPLTPLLPSREAFEAQLRAAGMEQWKTGYLPYSILDRWQQLALDFAYWRVLTAAEANPAWAAHQAWFKADRARREALILEEIGELSHFVGDGSQPMHVSIHYNGWGEYPNPNGYSTARLHAPFEGALVQATVTQAAVEKAMSPPKTCDCAVEQQVGDYLLATSREIVPFYEMEKAGGMAQGDPRGTAFAVQRLAVGASELRDLIAEAWQASLNRSVGWRPVTVQDVLSGKTDPYNALYAVD